MERIKLVKVLHCIPQQPNQALQQLFPKGQSAEQIDSSTQKKTYSPLLSAPLPLYNPDDQTKQKESGPKYGPFHAVSLPGCSVMVPGYFQDIRQRPHYADAVHKQQQHIKQIPRGNGGSPASRLIPHIYIALQNTVCSLPPDASRTPAAAPPLRKSYPLFCRTKIRRPRTALPRLR